MALFLFLGTSLFFGFLVLLLRETGSPLLADEGEARAGFLRGLLLAVPAVLLLAFLGGLVGVSYRPVRLYLYAFFRLHFLPGLLALGGFLLVGRREAGYVKVASYLLGFYALLNVSELLGSMGRHDVHDLFLLPLTRIACALLAAWLVTLAMEEYGPRQVPPLLLLLLVPLAGALVSWLAFAHRPLAAALAAAVLLAGSLALLARQGEIRRDGMRG